MALFFGTLNFSLAYIDPSSMTYIIQLIAGIIIVSGTVAGVVFHKIKRSFKKNKNDEALDLLISGGSDMEDDENLAD